MKTRLLAGCVLTAIAFGRQPARNLPSAEPPVDICMEPIQELMVSTTQARSLVSVIFSEIGVNLTWHTALSACDGLPGQPVRTAFTIRWAEQAPSTSPAGALAASHPFGSSGNSITIYQIPLQHFLRQNANAPEIVLAYVLAHELAHVMQGLDYHSASGILKTNWSYREYYMMLSHTLTFTVRDVDLIRAGLEAKRTNIASRQDASPWTAPRLKRAGDWATLH